MQENSANKSIAIQGSLGSYSEAAAQALVADATVVSKNSFEDVFLALESGEVVGAVLPIENTIAGRVADVHHLLPKAKAHIVAEHYLPIVHVLLGVPGTALSDIKEVHSHVHALGQCRKFLHEKGFEAKVHADTAGAAHDIASWGDKTKAAIASELAGKHYNLSVLARDIADFGQNTTRFVLLEKEAQVPSLVEGEKVITSIFFTLKSVPAALYKAIGGFATCGINLTRIESYLSGERFEVAQFFVDVEGHPESIEMQHAFDELKFFSTEVKLLGTYRAHEFREGM